MIEVYKILTNKYDADVAPHLQLSQTVNTRGNCLKLSAMRAKYDVRKFSFSFRVVSLWNSLPNNVVTSEAVNSFKNSLNAFWSDEEIYNDYLAEVAGSQLK